MPSVDKWPIVAVDNRSIDFIADAGITLPTDAGITLPTDAGITRPTDASITLPTDADGGRLADAIEEAARRRRMVDKRPTDGDIRWPTDTAAGAVQGRLTVAVGMRSRSVTVAHVDNDGWLTVAVDVVGNEGRLTAALCMRLLTAGVADLVVAVARVGNAGQLNSDDGRNVEGVKGGRQDTGPDHPIT